MGVPMIAGLIHPLVNIHSSQLKMAIEILDFPIRNGDPPYFLYVYQRVWTMPVKTMIWRYLCWTPHFDLALIGWSHIYIFSSLIIAAFLKVLKYMAGWWYTYPFQKYESQSGLLFPIYGKMCLTTNQMANLCYHTKWLQVSALTVNPFSPCLKYPSWSVTSSTSSRELAFGRYFFIGPWNSKSSVLDFWSSCLLLPWIPLSVHCVHWVPILWMTAKSCTSW